MQVSNPSSEARQPVVLIEYDDDVAVLIVDNPPVNASSRAVRSQLLEAIHTTCADSRVTAVVLIGAGKNFIAGSDIREFNAPLRDPQLPDVINAVETCPKAVVAAISGVALGGGYELALGCDARIATPDAVVGLPEVTLGIIPGAGGTQRLPRLVGHAKAIELIVNGTRIPAPQAIELGMIDATAEDDLRQSAVALARSMVGRKSRVIERDVPGDDRDSIEKAIQRARARRRGAVAVEEAIASILRAGAQPAEQALQAERTTFQRLRVGPEATALRYQFFAERAAARIPGIQDVKVRPVEKVGIIGAGTMGAGIAVAFLDADFEVGLIERDSESLAAGMERIRSIYESAVNGRRLDPGQVEDRLARLTPTVELSSLRDRDLLLEAVFEDIDVKCDLFRRLDEIARPEAIFASNTSYLDLNTIAAATHRPESVVGMHFFSPANVMRLLEIVRGERTATNVLATVVRVGRKLRKTTVVAGVCDGFIGNRVYSAYREQCEFMLEEGAFPDEIDEALEQFGFAMGPFAVSDLSGLDIAWQRRKRLEPTRDPRARYVEVADRLCEAGRFGRKTGRGWYRYKDDGTREPDPKVRQLIVESSERKGIKRRRMESGEIVRRAVYAMVNEAALVVEDAIAARPSDVDVVMVNGYSFPARLGGPLYWAAQRTPAENESALQEVATFTGFGFRKADLARVLASLRYEGTGTTPGSENAPSR